jgi:UrcA family protein
MKHLATTLIGALTLQAISPLGLAAVPADDARREVVRFADLDLTRPAGAQELYRRIKHAARNVCETFDRLGYDPSCVDQAIARAVADVDAPLLTARRQASTHREALEPREARLNRVKGDS